MRKEALPDLGQYFQVTTAKTSGLISLVFSYQTSVFQCEHLFTDKPMIITEPAIPSTQLIDLDLNDLTPSSDAAPLMCGT